MKLTQNTSNICGQIYMNLTDENPPRQKIIEHFQDSRFNGQENIIEDFLEETQGKDIYGRTLDEIIEALERTDLLKG